MRFYAFIFLLILSNFNSMAQTYKHKELGDGSVVEYFDFDEDGFYEIEVTKFKVKNKYDINTIKKTYDQTSKNVIKIETYQKDKKNDFEIKKTEIFKNSTKIREFKSVIKPHQEQNTLVTCSFEELSNLVGVNGIINQTLKTLPSGSIITKEGFLLDTSCLEKGGSKFLESLNLAYTKGFSCLENMAKNKGQGASMNLSQLKSNLAVKKIQLICNDTEYKWEKEDGRVNAYATVSFADTTKKLRHPGLSLSPHFAKRFNEDNGINSVAATIFHEMLHTNGYRHGDDIEYSKTCADCCFREGDKVDLACKICATRYDDKNFDDYLVDMISYTEFDYVTREHILKRIELSIKENPDKKEYVYMYASSMAGVFNPIGNEFSKLILKRNKLDEKYDLLLREASLYSPEEHVLFESISKPLALAYYDLYVDRNFKDVIKNIEIGFQNFKNLNLNKANEENKYLIDEMKQSMKNIVSSVYLDNNTGTSKLNSDEEYQLNLRLGKIWDDLKTF